MILPEAKTPQTWQAGRGVVAQGALSTSPRKKMRWPTAGGGYISQEFVLCKFFLVYLTKRQVEMCEISNLFQLLGYKQTPYSRNNLGIATSWL